MMRRHPSGLLKRVAMRVLLIVLGSMLVLWAVGVHGQLSSVDNPGVRGALTRWFIRLSPGLAARVQGYGSGANLALLSGCVLIIAAVLWPLRGRGNVDSGLRKSPEKPKRKLTKPNRKKRPNSARKSAGKKLRKKKS